MPLQYTLHHFYLKDDGIFPNNERLPVLLYKNALNILPFVGSNMVTASFEKNNWSNSWKSGVYTYHHYHSTTHEVLGIYKGATVLQLGGEKGPKLHVEKGDVLIIPAGVAHKNLQRERDILCVGAYPDGKVYDMNYGLKSERARADKNIARLPIPAKDPVFGVTGELQKFWK